MPGLLDIKRRIRSVQNTRKITKAMQMVSAAKMRKAQEAVVASRTYASLAWDLISSLSASIQSTNPLLESHQKAKKIGVILLTTNGGLVGSLNSNLIYKLREISKDAELITELVVYGKKGKNVAIRMGQNIAADFIKPEKKVSVEDIYPLAEFITASYKTGDYNKIVILYNHYVSTLVQKPTVKQLLPFITEASSVTDQRPINMHDTPNIDELDEKDDLSQNINSPYIFEPTPAKVLDHLLPRIIESQLYQTVLETNASEHSARMIMMKNATDAAGDLIADYTLTYNGLRQGKITTELSEITAGRIALE